MLGYYLELALRSLRRHLGLTALMIVAIAFGIGASMTTLTVMHVLSADPIPGKSERLFYVQLDPQPATGYVAGREPPSQLTRFDSEALLREAHAPRQAMMSSVRAAVQTTDAGPNQLRPLDVTVRATSADFFAMFEVPFAVGGPWTANDDYVALPVVVITKTLAEKLFGTTEVVGKSLRLERTLLRIVGVIGEFHPAPRFYDLTTAFGGDEQVFTPFSTATAAKLPVAGSMMCWAAGMQDINLAQTDLQAPCTWIQYWVELDTADQVAAYRDYLVAYSLEQAKAGRFERQPNVRLRNVREHLARNDIVPNDVKLQSWIALGFFLVCLVNTIGLLLTKFLRRSAEIGVRRALGASKRSIFMQLLVEAGTVGLIGGVLGLGLAWLGLYVVRQQQTPYANLAHLDTTMLIATFALAIGSSMLAGILPAWRGCHTTPSLQLKAQ